jgi:hypothetical protein
MTQEVKTPDLKDKICLVDARWSMFHGKEVKVISSAYMVIDGQPQWNCICADGSGGGILPQNILIPIEL